LGITAHALAAHKLNPAKLPMSDDVANRLAQHLANGLALVQSRTVYGSVINFAGNAVEGAVFDPDGFKGHPDYDYSGDLNPSFPGYTTAGGTVARLPNPASGVGWDISHARRLVQFLWTMQTLQTPLSLGFPAERILSGTAREIAYKVFNGSFTQPSFSNYMDGTNGWFRVNYSGRAGFGYEPGSWDLGRSFLTGGYGYWQTEVPDLTQILISSVKRETFSDNWAKIEILPAMPTSYFGQPSN
jgi:hypothetical protein